MKKLSLLTSFLGFSAFIFTSCGSTKLAIQDQTPVAVISIIGNTQVPWVDHDTEATTATGEPEAENLLTSMATKFVSSQDPEILTAVDRLDYVYDSIAQNLPELTGLSVLPKDDVLTHDSYKQLKSSYFNMLAATKKATNYKDLSTIGSKPARLFLKNVGAKSAILVSCTFQKDIAKGNRSTGTIKGVATLKIKMLNQKGKEVINKIYTADTEYLKIYDSEYNKEELVSLLNDAIDNTIRQFCMDISKLSIETPLTNAEETKTEDVKSTPIMIKKPADSLEATSATPETEQIPVTEPEKTEN
jgi:hypothetical protein